MILYRLTVPTSDGDVIVQRVVQDRAAATNAPVAGDFINPVPDDGSAIAFEVTARLWEMEGDRRLIIMAKIPHDPRAKVPTPSWPVHDGYLEALKDSGWMEAPH